MSATTTAPQFFHGTYAELTPGDLLRSGEQSGAYIHHRTTMVFGTTTNFDPSSLDWDEAADTAHNRLAASIQEALEWAADAADMLCDHPQHNHPADPSFHREAVLEGWAPACLRLYEIEPLGPVQPDPSSDAGPSAVMMPSARVVAVVPLAQRPVGQF